jgi:DnaK suppressor protein
MATLTNAPPERASWSAGKHAALNRLLRAQREVLREQKRSLREALPWETVAVADEEERAAQEFEVGLDITLLEMRSRQVQEMEAAVQLLESGEYGRCVDCCEAIQPSRLQAHPFAVRCCACQQVIEGRQDPKPPSKVAHPFWEGPAPAAWLRSGNGRTAPAPRKRRPVGVAVDTAGRPYRRGDRKVDRWLAAS